MFNANKGKKPEAHTVVASVEPVIDQTNKLIGTINLIKTSTRFYLRFVSSKNEKQQIASSISQTQENIPPDGFSAGHSFEVDCRLIKDIIFSDTKSIDGIVINISTKDSAVSRKLVFKQNLNQLTEFIFQIFLNGIAVPSFSSGQSLYLMFYSECSPNQFLHNSINIQPKRKNFETFDEFWRELISFSELYVGMLYKRQALIFNQLYPITAVTMSDIDVFMSNIDEFLKNSPSLTPITLEEFPTLFDENGKMKDPQSFKQRAFYCGIDENALPDALPFIFNLYSCENSTTESRKKQDEEQINQYKILKMQVDLIKETQLKRNSKLKSNSFDVIRNDAFRTDRDDPRGAFRHDFKTGMNMLISLLKAFCLYNQNIGYVQGMNDLFVPIILSYFPNWNDDGDPVDSDGNVLTNYEDLIPKMFWLYDSMLRNVNHDQFFLSITPHCQEIAQKVMNILDKIIPLLAIWLRNYNLQNLVFLYQDIIYLCKRSFDSVWDIWLQLHCSPDPKHWIVYFVCAVLIKTFPIFTASPDGIIAKSASQWFTDIIEIFQSPILKSLDIRELGRLALWIYENHPIKDDDDDDKQSNDINEMTKQFNFEYFDIDWLQ